MTQRETVEPVDAAPKQISLENVVELEPGLRSSIVDLFADYCTLFGVEAGNALVRRLYTQANASILERLMILDMATAPTRRTRSQRRKDARDAAKNSSV